MAIDERARLAALHSYRILDTAPEQAFDDLTLLASQVCQTPIASIGLIDEDRQFLKSRLGISMSEVPRDITFCTHTFQQREILQVPDALDDARFRDNPMVVGEPKVRFYAGAPLISPDGHTLGTLCVVDRIPRRLTEEQLRALDALRRQTEAQLELRRNLSELTRALAERDRAESSLAAVNHELRDSLDKVEKLSALIPLTSACELNLVIPATPGGIQTVSDGVMQLLQRKSWSETDLIKIDLALQEALANAIRHGCQGDPTKHVQCIVTCDANGELMIVVRDPGSGFDSTAVPNPLEGANMLKPSGRGVFLINQLMDEVAFRDGGREVQMRKRRETRAPAVP